jgi:hypothetical protein
MAPSNLFMVSIRDCRQFEIPHATDTRGTVSFFDPGTGFPFTPVRVFCLHSVPEGATRAGHAVRACEQLLVMMAGSCTLEVWDGKESARFLLSDRNQGVLVPPMIWRELRGFSADAVCLVLASRTFNEDCYIRSKEAYLVEIQQDG